MLKLKNINYKYSKESEISSVSNINIKANKGECILICGRSGSGKTTITKLINSLIPNYYENGELSGDIYMIGQSIKNAKIYEVSRMVTSVFQNPKTQFFNVSTTGEILFYLENRGFDRKFMEEKLGETTKLFKIEHLLNRDIFGLSGGEKQIIALAAAYATGTEMILLDEPSSNLDKEKTKILGEILQKIKEHGKTIILSEHRFYYMKEIIDRVYYLDGGVIKKEFTRETFFALDDNARKELGLRNPHFEELIKRKKSNSSEHKLSIQVINHRFKGTDRKLNIGDVDFNFGSIVGISGKNGAGKSTFIRLLMGLEKSHKTKIMIEGQHYSSKKRLKSSYLVMQDVNHQLFTDSVQTEVCLGKSDRYSEERVKEVLKNLNIYDLREKHPMSLSGGQKQRVAIASAILSGAKIICFDEPTSGMDYENMMRISRLIKNTINNEIIIFVISHDNEFLNTTVDEVFDIERFNLKEKES